MTWDRLETIEDPADYNLKTVPTTSRTATRGPTWTRPPTCSIRCWHLWESLPGGELNFPPDYPKMPGEPPRVQPSRKVAENWQ